MLTRVIVEEPRPEGLGLRGFPARHSPPIAWRIYLSYIIYLTLRVSPSNVEDGSWKVAQGYKR
eukprot:3242961-Pleurochrysis_carterae.AAC.2